jgi:hypothetical protein
MGIFQHRASSVTIRNPPWSMAHTLRIFLGHLSVLILALPYIRKPMAAVLFTLAIKQSSLILHP